jgi:hypothetical protein
MTTMDRLIVTILGVCVLSLVTAAPAFAQRKSCEALAAEIAAKLDAKGVKGYQLDIVAAEKVGNKQVLGSCDAGTKKITFRKATGSKRSGGKSRT